MSISADDLSTHVQPPFGASAAIIHAAAPLAATAALHATLLKPRACIAVGITTAFPQEDGFIFLSAGEEQLWADNWQEWRPHWAWAPSKP